MKIYSTPSGEPSPVASPKSHPLCVKIADVLRELRVERGFTMYEIEQRSDVSREMIRRVEGFLTKPTFDLVARICGVLRVSVATVVAMAEARL